MSKWKQKISKILCLVIALYGLPNTVYAAYTSPSYKTDEVFFGTGGELDSKSTNYRSKQSVGETGVGNYNSANYQANAGFNTTDTPFLEFTVNGTNINLGTQSTSTTSTGTATFSVRTYLASGYVVISNSPPPINGSYTMAGMAAQAVSAVGVEQFGINLVANSTGCAFPAPANFGAGPAQFPDTNFSYGSAATGYNVCGKYKYVPGDTIATSTKSSGRTDYTISYIMNVQTLTPGGTYTMNHSLVATSTY